MNIIETALERSAAVLAKTNILDVIGEHVRLMSQKGSHIGKCPFCNMPMFAVSETKQMYHCFNCGETGNAASFLMKLKDISYQAALSELAIRAGMAVPDFKPDPKTEEHRRKMLDIHKKAAVWYCKQLLGDKGKPAREYLAKRGLSVRQAARFGLGYSTGDYRGLYNALKKAGYSDEELVDSGLVRIGDKGPSDKFRDRLMFPIMDAESRVIGFGGRVMGEGEPKYLNSPETSIFDKSRTLYGLNNAIAAAKNGVKEFLCCEGYMDVIAMNLAGFPNAVASLGTAFTPSHAVLMRQHVDTVILSYDNDDAGKKAARRAAPILTAAGLKIKCIDLSPCKDPDELVKKFGADEFRKRVAAAKDFTDFE